ncbi:YegP family protein [Arthrobacter sp. SPG23]|uniref:YegP family protein n=1 Tax=Arthrobacter sp. SPG23 TaxID=1610703 RepID=UPI00069751CE|nr:YegP family protein [Arthrobacter sp. SPG23]
MSGHFELISAPDGGYRFRLIGKAGELVAVSVKFPTKRAAAQGISLVREIAGTGLIRDMSNSRRIEPSHRIRPSQPAPVHSGAPLLRTRAAHNLRPEYGPAQLSSATRR